MAYINLIKLLFAQMTLFMFVLSGLMNTLENHLPVFITRTFRYGKFAYEGTAKCLINPIEVPKSWFRHFYIFSSVGSLIALYLGVNSYIFNHAVPNSVVEFLNILNGAQHGAQHATGTPMATLIALFLFALQNCRRFYDTQFVSVFGANSRMNLTHYLVGYMHYAGAILAILLEAPNFTVLSRNNIQLNISDIKSTELIGIGIFLWSWWHQHKATVILGNLRKNSKGQVVSNGHHMPEGDLFEFISSPHLTTEILIYFSLTIILWNNTTWWFVFIWVLTNQVETAMLSHWWYEKTFPNYPKTRKILIPYIF